MRAHGRPQAERHQPPTAGGLDRHSVKTPALGGERGYDKGTTITGRTRPVVVATLGLLMAVSVTAASVADPAGARLLCARLGGAWKKRRLIGVAGA